MILIKRDMYRALNSIYMQIALIAAIIFSTLFTYFVGTGQRIGISIFGELTTYKNLSEVIFNGVNYTKGLGFLITLVVSLFIAQEYQYNTWQHYICSGRKRITIYLQKYLFSILLALIIFLVYVLSFYITSLLIGKPFSLKTMFFIVERGVIVYITLASIIVLLSMSIKNYIASILISIFFVLLEKDVLGLILGFIKKININIGSIGNFSLMKINSVAPMENISVLKDMVVPCAFLIIVTILLGYYNFSKFEL